MSKKVFISYRRRDSVAHVHALHGRLAALLGPDRIFMDVDTIELGTDFLASIREAIGLSEVMIAVIGPQWAGGDKPGARRIDRDDDVVRLEIAAALGQGIRVVPLLLGGARLPAPSELPPDLAGLGRRQGFSIRDDRFADDMALFVQRVCHGLEDEASEPAPADGPEAPTPSADAALDGLADKVRRFWIQGVLEPSAPAVGRVSLDYVLREDLVSNPFEDYINPLPRETVVTAGTAPLDSSEPDLQTLFESRRHRLLLLGEPGSGKTTSLLALAAALLDRRRDDASQPVPVVLHLAGWRPDSGGLAGWIISELNNKYRIPLGLGRQWVERQRLLPLLDGLDEVPEAHRVGCAREIRDWALAQAGQGFVLCSRIGDYERLPVRVPVGAALCLQPLSDTGLRYLWKARGIPTGELRAWPDLGDLGAIARTPLMAKLAATIRDAAPGPLGTTALFDLYVSELFRRCPRARARLQPATALPILGRIAEEMGRRGITQLQVESLDAGWLGSTWQRVAFGLLFAALIGILGGAILALYWGLMAPILSTREFGCGSGLPADGVCAASARLQPLWFVVTPVWGMILVAIDPWLPKGGTGVGRLAHLARVVIPGAMLYLLLWMLLWFGALTLVSGGASLGIASVVLLLLSGFGISVLIAAWRDQRSGLTGPVRALEAIAWDKRGALHGMLYALPVGVGLWLINTIAARAWLPEALLPYLIMTVPVGVLLGGLRGRSVPQKIRPNEGIRLSARNALIATGFCAWAGVLIGGATGLLFWGLVRDYLPTQQQADASVQTAYVLRYAISSGFILSAVAALWFGGAEVIKHGVLRLMLAVTGRLPLDLVGFLDTACDLALMQRAGGSYLFTHRLLGEHIAAHWRALARG